jgi:UDP-3-O-[3-hydroxymyristoyl] glucosamine N-acyltransferase
MLSILKNAGPGSITYYVGDNPNHISHLNNCKLYCKQKFDIDNSVEQIIVDNPQLEFYKLSHTIENEYNFHPNSGIYKTGINCNIHPTAVIADDVTIGNDVTIGPNSVIYAKTKIGNNVRIDSNVTIGTEGMMWVWDGNDKVFLKQLGGVIIGNGCIIGSNSVIVRGSANENTIIEDGANMAPGCCIGHGSVIGKNTHLANNISVGGSADLGSYNFYGCGSIVNPGVKVNTTDVILGGGSTLTKSIDESGVYFGLPSKKIKNINEKHSGVPIWKK